MPNNNFMENIVYHYCSATVFKKIIENKALRLSDVTESNDSKEIIYNNAFIKQYVQSKINGFSRKFKLNRFKKEELLQIVFNHFSFYMEDFYYRPYACCFSYNGDLLSQWRGYADDGRGFAIGFDLNMLRKIGKPEKDDRISNDIFELGDVIYNEKEERKRIRIIVNALFDWFADDIKTKGYDPNAFIVDANILMKFLFKNCLFYKNSFFEEEKEWRLCFYAQPNSKVEHTFISKGYSFSEMGYFLRDNRLVSYVDLFFKQHPEIIKKIIIGPKNNSNMVYSFVSRYGITCDILKSKGSYR